MSRKICVSDEELFNINTAAKEAICLLCGKKITDLRKFSYHRHYKTLHKDFSRMKGILHDEHNENEPGPSRKVAKIEVRIDRKTYTASLVELVTVNGLPLNVLNYPGFKNLVTPIEEGLKIKHLDPLSMRQVLANVAEQIKHLLIEEISGKMICLKMDAATRMDRDFLGINIQFVDKKLIKIRTLGILELHDRHTAENLTTEVLNCLNPYGIDIRRLLSVTTDNASNMVATINRLKITQETAFNDSIDEILNPLEEQRDGSEDENEEESYDDDSKEEPNGKLQLVEAVLQGVRCAEHTLQLAVNDALKHTNMKSQLVMVRKVVKSLRKLPHKKVFAVSKRTKPILDCPTRWNSTYAMVQSLTKEKDFIQTLTEGEQNIVDYDMWTFLEQFETAFQPVAKATEKLQHSQLTFGDFYLIWEKCSFELIDSKNDFSLIIAEKMGIRKQALMNNKCFLAAVFVDQRINFRNSPFMSDEQRSLALDFIKQTWTTMQSLIGRDVLSDDMQSTGGVIEDPFEAYLSTLDKTNDAIQDKHLIDEITDLSRMTRLKLPLTNHKEENILEWWYRTTKPKPELFSLVSAFLAIPCTQVSVERSFSALALILTKHRTLLSEETLKNILLIRINSDLLKKVDYQKS